ncbi:MAG: YfiR family protein [Thiovulaceae bacterium]|nr:YfiR family protein [Sulfurimonadaceae bacterium]
MKIFIGIFLIFNFLYSKTLDNSLLDIHATIMPKVLLLEHDIEKKIVDNKIHITIAYEKNSYKDMKFLKKSIETKYPKGISGYKIEIDFINYDSFQECKKHTNILYIFPSSQDNINNLITKYNECHAITFASQKEYLKNNAMISIDVGKKVKPIVNLKAVKASGISFKPVLLSISKVFKK